MNEGANPKRRYRSPEMSFDARVQKDVSGCWLWTGFVDRKGYGVIGVGGRKLSKAHRFSYERFVGPVPDGMQLDHLCRVRNCVNPSHLEPVTNRENVIRGNAARPAKTHCKNGHPYKENLYLNPRGHRECMKCRTEAARRHYRRIEIG